MIYFDFDEMMIEAYSKKKVNNLLYNKICFNHRKKISDAFDKHVVVAIDIPMMTLLRYTTDMETGYSI